MDGDCTENARGMHVQSCCHILVCTYVFIICLTVCIPRGFSVPFPLVALPCIHYAIPVHSPQSSATFLGGVGKSPRIQSALRTINRFYVISNKIEKMQ